jgi:hypothetical protein
LAIVGSKLAGPVLGAILAVFPVIFTSTMVILYLRQGPSFTGATGTTMILGSVNVVAFAVIAAFTLPAWGAAWGTLAAIVGSYLWSAGGYVLVETIARRGCPSVRNQKVFLPMRGLTHGDRAIRNSPLRGNARDPGRSDRRGVQMQRVNYHRLKSVACNYARPSSEA